MAPKSHNASSSTATCSAATDTNTTEEAMVSETVGAVTGSAATETIAGTSASETFPKPNATTEIAVETSPLVAAPTSVGSNDVFRHDQLDQMVRKLLETHAKGDGKGVERALSALMAGLKSGKTYSRASVDNWVRILQSIVQQKTYSVTLQHKCREHLKLGQQISSLPKRSGGSILSHSLGVGSDIKHGSDLGRNRLPFLGGTGGRERIFSDQWSDIPEDLVDFLGLESDGSGVIEQREAGWRGEQMAAQLLQKFHPDVKVIWVNEKEEQGLPYDICMQSGDDNVVYVEVKTIGVDKQWCHISWPQHEFCMRESPKGSFELFCIRGTRYFREKRLDHRLSHSGYILHISSDSVV